MRVFAVELKYIQEAPGGRGTHTRWGQIARLLFPPLRPPGWHLLNLFWWWDTAEHSLMLFSGSCFHVLLFGYQCPKWRQKYIAFSVATANFLVPIILIWGLMFRFAMEVQRQTYCYVTKLAWLCSCVIGLWTGGGPAWTGACGFLFWATSRFCWADTRSCCRARSSI